MNQSICMVVRLMQMLSSEQLDQALAQFNSTRFTEELVRQPKEENVEEAA